MAATTNKNMDEKKLSAHASVYIPGTQRAEISVGQEVAKPEKWKKKKDTRTDDNTLKPSINNKVEILHNFSDFLAVVCQRNMKLTLQAHAPSCTCSKVGSLNLLIVCLILV
jgi:hypothetical protein